MASRLLSRATPRNDVDVRREYGTHAAKPAAVRRILAALARAHRQTMRFEIARHRRSGTQMGTEVEHRLSWRFGVPVR
jgi:predicted metal-dependent phosphotriesterase family hydrolase